MNEDTPIIGKQPETKVTEELDILLFAAVNGLEIPLQIKRTDPDPDFTQAFVYLPSYYTKRFIRVFLRNVVLQDRLPEVEYLSNVEEAKIRQALAMGQTRGGITLPRMTIPSKRNN